MPRFLGIDYGTKRIGLALSDVGALIASPLSVIGGKGARKGASKGGSAAHAQEVAAVGEEHGVDAFVVGLPLNMDGTQGLQANLTRAFGELLAAATGRPIHYWDERLSSHGADVYLSEAGLSRKKHKARRDAVAAQIILQSFLDARRIEPPDEIEQVPEEGDGI